MGERPFAIYRFEDLGNDFASKISAVFVIPLQQRLTVAQLGTLHGSIRIISAPTGCLIAARGNKAIRCGH